MNEVFTRPSNQGRPVADFQGDPRQLYAPLPLGVRQIVTPLPQGQQPAGTVTLPKRYWRVDEVAAYFAISTRTVYRLLEDGALQTIRIRSCRRVALAEVKRFEKKLMDEDPF